MLFTRKHLLKHLLLLCSALAIAILGCNLPGIVSPVGKSVTSLGTATVLPAYPLQPALTQEPLPPALIETDPLQGTEIPLNKPITLYFNQAMDRASVEMALHIALAIQAVEVEGSGAGNRPTVWSEILALRSWKDQSTLVLTPKPPLAPDSDLRIYLGSSAHSTQGLALTQPISLTYQTAGYLTLTQHLPESGAKEVEPTSAIVATFNRPVIPLSSNTANLKPAFQLDPSAQGQGNWLNTSTYIFYPDPPLLGGKTYTVRLDPSIQSTQGSPLKGERTWQFTTARPRLVSIEPASGAKIVRLDTSLVLTFNQPMNPSNVENNFQLVGPDNRPVPGHKTWNHENTVLTFKPTALLARNTTYTVQLNNQAQARSGTPLESPLQTSFQTISALSILTSKPEQGGQLNPDTSLVLYLSAPIPDIDVLQWVTVKPSVPELRSEWNEEERSLSLSGNFTPNTAYSLDISQDLADIWGGHLLEPPSGGVSLNVAGYHLDFRTTHLPASLVVPASNDVLFLTGQDTNLSIQTTNLSKISLSIGSVPQNNFISMLGLGGHDLRQNFIPDDLRSWEQTLIQSTDHSQVSDLYLNLNRTPLLPGLYWLKFNLPESVAKPLPYLMVVSNIQLTYKISATDALVWAVDLRDHAPVSNTTLTLYAEDGTALASGQTDAEGIFRTSLTPRKDPYRVTYAVLGKPGQDGFGLVPSSWGLGAASWEYGLLALDSISSDYSGAHPKGYFYTDRPIYRPGQTIYFRGVLRQANDGHYPLLNMDSLPLTIQDESGQELTTMDIPLSAFGTVHGQYALPANAHAGVYRITSSVLPYDSLSFQVADYRKPVINLKVAFSEPLFPATDAQNGTQDALAGQALTATINARYFFNAPAGNLPIHWSLSATPFPFDLPGYQVEPLPAGTVDPLPYPQSSNPGSLVLAQGDAETQSDGVVILELPVLPASLTRQQYTLEVTAKDDGNLPISARTTILINPARFYIGLRPDAWIGQAGVSASFEIQLGDWQRIFQGEYTLRAEYYKLVSSQTKSEQQEISGITFSDDPGQNSLNYLRRIPIASTDFRTNSAGQARVSFIPAEPGIYQIDVYGILTDDNQAKTQLIYWVDGAGQSILSILPDHQLPLIADHPSYQSGETAQVFIPSSFEVDVPALITIERGEILHYQLIQLKPGGNYLNLPLNTEDTPNIYISATLLGKDAQGHPDYRHGYLNLAIMPLKQSLDVQVIRPPDQPGPGGNLNFEIRVKDQQGQPIQGEFSVAIVDQAVLSLAEPNPKDIFSAFFGFQPLGVRTGFDLSAYGQNLPLADGGGGTRRVEINSLVVRESFPDTAFWQADVLTDSQGKAQINTLLPNTLTTWQVDIQGITQDTRVGKAQIQVTTTKELMIRPVTPRFLVSGDHVRLSATLQNNTNHDLLVEASLQATGFELDNPAMMTQKTPVPAAGNTRLDWWGTVQDVATADLIFTVEGNDVTSGITYKDTAHPAQGQLPILHSRVRWTFQAAGVLPEAGDRQELVSLPKNYLEPSGNNSSVGNSALHIELTPSLAAVITSAMDALENNLPDDSELLFSNEQALSLLLSTMEAYRVFQQFGLQSVELKTRLEESETIPHGLLHIQDLLFRQNPDGGWGWWPGGSSDPQMTAYFVFGLARLQQMGLAVNIERIQRASNYLQSQLPAPEMLAQSNQLDLFTWINYAQVVAGKKDPSYTNTLYALQDQLAPWAKAFLVQTLEILAQDNESDLFSRNAQNLLSILQAEAIRSTAGTYWENSPALQSGQTDSLRSSSPVSNPIATTAIVVYTLAQHDPGSPILADTVRFLMSQRQADGGWCSTYNTAWAALALIEVIKGTGEPGGNFSYAASLNGIPILNGQADAIPTTLTHPASADIPPADLFPDAPNRLVIHRGAGSGRLYYSTALSLEISPEQIVPLSQGMSLSRAYYLTEKTCPTGACSPTQAAQTGQRVQVRLTLTLPNDTSYLMVEDFIPAGAEILDTRLPTSLVGSEPIPTDQRNYDPRRPFEAGWGEWFFHPAQIAVDHIAWTSDYLPAGTYELVYHLVATQPGEYRVLPAQAWQFYAPEIQANSAGNIFLIKP